MAFDAFDGGPISPPENHKHECDSCGDWFVSDQVISTRKSIFCLRCVGAQIEEGIGHLYDDPKMYDEAERRILEDLK